MYKFPVITNINEVLPHIQGYDGFNVVVKDGYTVIDYAVDIPGQFDGEGFEFRRECRGLIFENETGHLIRRPYNKFFNVNQKEETLMSNIMEMIAQHGVTYLNKEDGSMISPFLLNGKVLWGTRRGVTDVSLQMESELGVAKMQHFSNRVEPFIRMGLSLMFEYVSPENKIVLNYSEPKLILTGVRSMYDGKYFPVQDYTGHFLVVDTHVVEDDFQSVYDSFKTASGIEGTVGVLGNGYMFKIKGDEYVLLHKSKERVSIEREVWRIIIEGTVDDFIPLLDERDRVTVNKYEVEFEELVSGYVSYMVNSVNEASIKERKWIAQQTKWDAVDKACIFKYLDGVSVREFITGMILKNTYQDKKFYEFKDMLKKKVGVE